MKILYSILFILFLNSFAFSKALDFDFFKMGVQDENTMLLLGGIHGDEPGGFMSASLITTHYKITKGSLWVVPNLNFYSILKSSRGALGNMNRKFGPYLPKNDPDYEIVQKTKDYINDEKVKLVLNLHDGSGYYRPKYENSQFAPKRWGQSVVIDKSNLENVKYGNLSEISSNVVKNVNKYRLNHNEKFHVKNTKTQADDDYMGDSLTYYAFLNNKPAFASEASKSLNLQTRIYYHLLVVENFMKNMGIEFQRDFELTPDAINDVLNNDISLSFNEGKIKIPLADIKRNIEYFPIPSNKDLQVRVSNPLMKVVNDNGIYDVLFGNRRITRIKPEYVNFGDAKNNIVDLVVDNENKKIKYGDLVSVKNSFLVKKIDGLRVNIIGYKNSIKQNEFELFINKNEIKKNYSLDYKGNIYRAEFYKKNEFVGMILIKFESLDS